ncbi:DUF262 domain-containing protein [Cohnella algarum]|uniref:DUF262 domain-containing protein n=1 Tax=Cohnella algarum TaxID=2044859 RepID=UPI001968525A|nr:DUF262 domain-containing protein [Cohnella algarum]MBN2981570.1 DUF262 domain-containing protein [Cohnella algarum]
MNFKNDPKPDILRIEELVLKVKTGDIKLPKFQRPFVWKKEDILALLDSIYKSYPIGSILLWLTKEKLASERKIGDLDINERPEEYPTNYLLDGQQRLSTLCGALYWDGKDTKSMWNIVFDLERETFIYPEEEEKIEYFPLNKLLSTIDFLNKCRQFETHKQKEKYFRNAESLLKSIKDYKIAAVTIGDMSINEVAPIFERINSTGRRLTMVDLMRAATWSGQFDLNDTIDSIRTSLSIQRFEDVPETEIVRNLSSCAGFGINKDDIEKLRGCDPAVLKEAGEKCKNAYEHAVDFITRELPVTSHDYIPYSLQVTMIVDFFDKCPRPTFEQREQLKQWFWKTSISRYFAAFNTAQLAIDLRNVQDFALNIQSQLRFTRLIDFENFSNDSFRLNKATSKTFGLLLASNKPLSLLDGTSINTNTALAVVNRHEYHHIFPKAFLRSNGYSLDQIDNHSNICMLSLGNNREISDTKPSIYFKTLIEKLGGNLDRVLASNLINKEALEVR